MLFEAIPTASNFQKIIQYFAAHYKIAQNVYNLFNEVFPDNKIAPQRGAVFIIPKSPVVTMRNTHKRLPLGDLTISRWADILVHMEMKNILSL